MTTTHYAQSTFTQAINILQQSFDSRDANNKDEAMVALKLLTILKMLSKSGNTVPGLRGQGLREGLGLAEEVINHGTCNLKIVNQSYASEFLAYFSGSSMEENNLVRMNRGDKLNTKKLATELIQY